MRALGPLLLALALFAAPAARADDPPPDGADAAMAAAREAKLKQLRKDLKKWAQGPYAADHKDDILKTIEALATLGGVDAAKAVLEGVFDTDKDVRDKVFALVEKV